MKIPWLNQLNQLNPTLHPVKSHQHLPRCGCNVSPSARCRGGLVGLAASTRFLASLFATRLHGRDPLWGWLRLSSLRPIVALTFPLKSQVWLMDWVPKILGVLIQGSQSNWWGIGCPAHCFATGVPSLFLAFGFGLTSGIIIGIGLCLWVFGFGFTHPCPAGSPSLAASRQPSDRVRAYLNESGPILQLRRRRD